MVLHHWDADGISSACMAIEAVRDASPGAAVRSTAPTIGRWGLDAAEVGELRSWGPELLVIVDLALGARDLASIVEGVGAPAVMVDHHRASPASHPRVEYHNPLAEGLPEAQAPSCTWVIMGLQGRPLDLLCALGVLGDRGRGVVDEPVWADLGPFLEREGWAPDELHRLVELLDAPAKTRDRDRVNAAVGALLEGMGEPRRLLERPEWTACAAEVERVLERQLAIGPERVVGSTLVKTIDTPYLVVSAAARRLARTRGLRAVVVANVGFSGTEAQLYVRGRGDIDLSPLIGQLAGRGLSAGGKRDVVGAVVPKEALDGVTEVVMGFVGSAGTAGSAGPSGPVGPAGSGKGKGLLEG
jgi:single-stranded DNA-specific DHH superfamily exonuclease